MTAERKHLITACASVIALAACGGVDDPDGDGPPVTSPVSDMSQGNNAIADADMAQDMPERDWREEGLPYADEVILFSPGVGAGYGSSKMPEVVLGPPVGKGTGAGSFDVVSLGSGGEIILSVGDGFIVDGDGDDFVVYENPFWAAKDPLQVFEELGEVSVSEDGEEWFAFPCDLEPEPEAQWHGCAGWSPTLVFDPFAHMNLDVEVTGWDAFDLATVGLERAKFIKIRDLSDPEDAVAPSAGFDLDAVGVIHHEE